MYSPTLTCLASLLLVVITSNASADDALLPNLKTQKPGVTATLIAEHPQVATPTGIDVDRDRNVWVLSCHTHFRPEGYVGPKFDEVLVFNADATSPASNGPARRVFYAKTTATMDLELGPGGWVYLAERDRILRVKDTDNDGIGDVEQTIADLQTEEQYPHNGLSGMTWDHKGNLLFSLGENYWKPWTLTGTDGTKITGTGEGGVFRCSAEGKKLERVARGFWNPFGLTVQNDGSIFTCENDPGARPPCRLLHVVEGGDYGYQRAYGRAPSHPFACWNGELRGTLPMLHATGEAPCGIVPLGGGLLVTSWADHRIDFFPLERKGASFETERVELLTGSDVFRPTGIVRFGPDRFASPLAPDGAVLNRGTGEEPITHTLYFADWVKGSYEIHGKGRVWRLEVDQAKANGWLPSRMPKGNLSKHIAQDLLGPNPRRANVPTAHRPLLRRIADPNSDPFLVNATIGCLARPTTYRAKPDDVRRMEPLLRLASLLVEKRHDPTAKQWPEMFLKDDDLEVRFEALRWIADANLTDFLPNVAKILTRRDVSYREFEAALACWNTLSGNPRAGISDPAALLARLKDSNAPARIRAFALRLLPVTHKELNAKRLGSLADHADRDLSLEAIRSLARQSSVARKNLARIAFDPKRSVEQRTTATAGLAPAASEYVDGLFLLAASDNKAIANEALRALRFTQLDAVQLTRLKSLTSVPASQIVTAIIDPETLKQDRPDVKDIDVWLTRLDQLTGDADAGERIFHHAKVGMCAKCHRHTGRGNIVGPDLSAAGGGKDAKRRLLTALLQPHRDVDPQFYPWTIVTVDGLSFTGIPLRKGGRSGKEFYRDNAGQERAFLKADIEFRKELKTSLMPEGLVFTMTDQEVADVLAFLQESTVTPSKPSQPAAVAKFTGEPKEKQIAAFVGEWGFDFPDGYGGWLKVHKDDDGKLAAQVLWRVGSARPAQQVELKDGRLHLTYKRNKRGTVGYVVAFTHATRTGELDRDRITLMRLNADNEATPVIGRRLPPMPPKPDLSKVKFGTPKQLFNGKDLHGWFLQPETVKNGWSVQNGELTNTTPKTDFSAYGDHGNLRTALTFGDCKLHIEFNVAKNCNSGIYVRGLYEAQVVDRDSRMQGIAGVGAVFGRVAPLKNAGKAGGEWQTYDITLVDRHMTVVLNGEKVIDNQPVAGCTGGALFGDVTRKGPLYLQGDHTSVKYRNIVIRERVE